MEAHPSGFAGQRRAGVGGVGKLAWLMALGLMACNEAPIEPGQPVDVSPSDTRDTRQDTSTPDVPDGTSPHDGTAGDTAVDVDVGPDGGCPTVIVDPGHPLATSVHVAGSWNGFSQDALPMDRVDGVWRAEVALPPGEYAYKLVVNGEFEGALSREVPTHWEGGVENRNLIVADCALPALTVEAPAVGPVAGGQAEITARVCAGPGATGAALMGPPEVTLGREGVTPTADGPGCYEVRATRGVGKHSLRVTARDVDGRESSLWVPLWVEAARFDWRDAMLYMIMVDRFRDGDGVVADVGGVPPISNYQGGDLEGLGEAIDEGYFDALGVDALWLTPVLENPEGAYVGRDDPNMYAGYHGYWPVDPMHIERRIAGTDDVAEAEARFEQLVAKAHARGIRVVIDVVLNHVHEDHVYCDERPAMCKRTCVCGKDGCSWDDRPLDCQFAPYLPDLDYRDHATLVRVVDDLMAMAARYDVDGFRLDAVKHVDHAVLKAVRQRIEAIEARGGAPFWLVGEVFTGAGGHGQIMDYVGPAELDGQFDFPLYWAIRQAFVHDGSMRDLEKALVASEAAYGDALAYMSPFLGNHDVERIATALAKNDLGPWGGTLDVLETSGDTPTRWDVINPLTMAMAFLTTLRGVPLLYMGDELGLAGSGDPDNRRMLPEALSADRSEILRRVQELGAARREQPVIRRGNRREIWIDDDVYLQARWLPVGDPALGGQASGAARVAVVALNKGDTKTLDVTLPAELGVTGGTLRSLLSDRTVSVTNSGFRLELASWEYILFVLE